MLLLGKRGTEWMQIPTELTCLLLSQRWAFQRRPCQSACLGFPISQWHRAHLLSEEINPSMWHLSKLAPQTRVGFRVELAVLERVHFSITSTVFKHSKLRIVVV